MFSDSNHLSNLAQLRELLHRMEDDSGLCALSQNERDVLYAVERECAAKGIARTESIRASPLASRLTQPTFHRALRSLVDKGFLKTPPGRKNGAYVLAAAGSD